MFGVPTTQKMNAGGAKVGGDMMMTRLWHALKNVSVYDPIYRRALAPERIRVRRSVPLLLRFGLVAVLFSAFCGGMSVAPDLVWGIVFTLLAGIPLVYIALNGTLSGISWTSQIALDILHERERGTYQVLSTMPPGAAGTSWTLCAATLNRHGAFGSEDAERVWILRTMLAIAIVFALVIFASRPQNWDAANDQTMIGLASVMALLVAFRIDDIQSVVTSGLVGMLISTFALDAVDTRLWSVVAFLSAQVGGYALTWIAGFALLPAAFASLGLPTFYTEILLVVARLVLFFAIREGINRALWAALARRFDTSAADLYAATALR
jgi:hypothetical protein